MAVSEKRGRESGHRVVEVGDSEAGAARGGGEVVGDAGESDFGGAIRVLGGVSKRIDD
jgi:hypothetical protein